MRPLFVATIQRPPRRAIDWTRPAPGTRSPVDTPIIPLGPCKIALPFITSRTTQLAIFFASMGACGSDGLTAGAEAWTSTGVAFGVVLLARAGACVGIS